MNSLSSILIVDDDEDDIFLIKDRLASLGCINCNIVSCSEKDQAVSFLRHRTFDICILDYRLAGYKGIDILESVADAQLATPIIMLTGQDDKEVAKVAIKLGAQDFIPKASIDEEIFEKSILYAISRKELEFAKYIGKINESENIAKDRFIAHLSHELRTPLTSILGYTSLLLEKEEALPLQKELNVISNNGKHLLNLLNDVLDLSKISAGKFELNPQKTDLQQVLNEINALLCVSALDKGLSLGFKSVSKIPQFVYIDELRFKQVLFNLIGNAIKFTDKGSISISVSLLHEAKQPLLLFEIEDTGIGMTEAQIQTIFTPFKQVEDVANRKAGGAGLGLSISAEIVKQMGGILKVDSKPGKGSVFTLHLPCRFEPQTHILFDFALEGAQVSSLSAPSLAGKVLIVDDLFEIRQLAGHFVKQTGVAIEYAKHGEEAISSIQRADTNNAPFDLVFMDLHMPVLTGKEAMERIVKLNSQLPVYAMTAAVGKGLQAEIRCLGFSGLVAKPLDKTILWEILQKHLAKDEKRDKSNQSLADPVENKPLLHLVEDDADSADIMSLMIVSLGYKVLHSANGEQALQNAQNQQIQVHLVDLGLPDFPSESLLNALFAKPISGRVFILSGSQPNPSLLKQYPIEQHLIKPIDKQTLAQILT